MATVIWEPVKSQRCDRVGEWVRLEVRVAYPAELLPDQPPRVLARRCSHAMECSSIDRPACGWAGSWPGHDPML
jgi:hypothetical protein